MIINRDMTRQSKVSSVVNATVYSFIADDATKSIKSLTFTNCITSSPNTTQEQDTEPNSATCTTSLQQTKIRTYK